MDSNSGAPRTSRHSPNAWIWSIGIYTGTAPLRLAATPSVSNPVLSAKNVLDIPARFVADPFMVKVSGVWHMFFEVMNDATGKGDIGLATSANGFDWQYQRIVLTEPFHLSYPYVFEWNDDYYMIPETLGARVARIYRAEPFPDRWVYMKDLLPGDHADPSIFRFQDQWWMFTCPFPYKHDTLSLFYASDPLSAWTPHPHNPLISGDRRIARPGGRVLQHDGALIRLTQDCDPTYGRQLRALQITELTANSYKEHERPESPILTPSGSGWNSSGMHHADIHRLDDQSWIACVDGLWSSEGEPSH